MPHLQEVASGVRVATSRQFITTTTVVTGSGRHCLVVDPAVTVQELATLAREIAQLGLAPQVGFSTHPHWDHVLWCDALGQAPRYATARAVAIAETERDGMVAGVQAAAPGHDLARFGRLSPLPAGATAIPWSGPEAQVIVHDGHAPGHAAVFLPTTGTLVCGDMLSDVEVPLLDLAEPDPVGDYRRALDRLSLPSGVRLLVPGHGHVGDAAEFRRRIAADNRYLDALEQGRVCEDRRLDVPWLRRQHDVQWAHLRT